MGYTVAAAAHRVKQPLRRFVQGSDRVALVDPIAGELLALDHSGRVAK